MEGASRRPVPPGVGKDKDARWIDIYEEDEFDAAQMASWVQQAAALPGLDPLVDRPDALSRLRTARFKRG